MFAYIFLSVFLTSVVEARYSVGKLPLDQRQSICTKTTAFCLNACLQKTSSNTCDVETMAFSCLCEDGKSPVDVHYFPIQAQQCVGENQDCRNSCASQGLIGQALDTCSNLCDQQFVCGTPNAQEQLDFYSSDGSTNLSGGSDDSSSTSTTGTTSTATSVSSTLRTADTSTTSKTSSASSASATATATTAPTLNSGAASCRSGSASFGIVCSLFSVVYLFYM